MFEPSHRVWVHSLLAAGIVAAIGSVAPAIAQGRPADSLLAQNTFSGQQSYCTATLVANDPGARITLRSGPGTGYGSLGYGIAGDFVYVLSQNPPEADYATDGQGYGWRRVGFPRSGATGWIREDFLSLTCAD